MEKQDVLNDLQYLKNKKATEWSTYDIGTAKIYLEHLEKKLKRSE